LSLNWKTEGVMHNERGDGDDDDDDDDEEEEEYEMMNWCE